MLNVIIVFIDTMKQLDCKINNPNEPPVCMSSDTIVEADMELKIMATWGRSIFFLVTIKIISKEYLSQTWAIIKDSTNLYHSCYN